LVEVSTGMAGFGCTNMPLHHADPVRTPDGPGNIFQSLDLLRFYPIYRTV